ncbi:MAG: response regulator [Proteobacteria bacterium]|nr:response regulator [Pseudomonadota bacterium]MBU1640888.1 response regulator [Pseudomonadota bacterium]
MENQNTQKRILIMDDEATIRTLLEESLQFMGFDVFATVCGEDAVAAYSQAVKDNSRFDVVIMDLTVRHGMGGEEAAALIGKTYPDAIIVAASGDAGAPAMEHSEDFGFRGHVSKPFNLQELSSYINSLLGQ